jgi:hypothetical protein
VRGHRRDRAGGDRRAASVEDALARWRAVGVDGLPSAPLPPPARPRRRYPAVVPRPCPGVRRGQPGNVAAKVGNVKLVVAGDGAIGVGGLLGDALAGKRA